MDQQDTHSSRCICILFTDALPEERWCRLFSAALVPRAELGKYVRRIARAAMPFMFARRCDVERENWAGRTRGVPQLRKTSHKRHSRQSLFACSRCSRTSIEPIAVHVELTNEGQTISFTTLGVISRIYVAVVHVLWINKSSQSVNIQRAHRKSRSIGEKNPDEHV